MFKDKFYIYFAFLAILFLTSCQEDNPSEPEQEKGTIQGQVVATNKQTSAEGLLVSTVPATSNQTTDKDGNFEFTNIKADNYTIRVIYKQNIIGTKQIKLDPGEVETVVIEVDLEVVNISAGLTSYFKFNSEIKDEMNSERISLASNVEFTEDMNGNTSSALKFSGKNSFLELEMPDVELSGDFSIAFQFQLTGAFSEHSINQLAGNDSFRIYVDKKILSFQFDKKVQDEIHLIKAQTEFETDNEWAHCTMIYTEDNVTFFVNGIHFGSLDVSGWEKSFDELILGYLGQDVEGNELALEGKIDELRIYDRKLLFDEIQILKDI